MNKLPYTLENAGMFDVQIHLMTKYDIFYISENLKVS